MGHCHFPFSWCKSFVKTRKYGGPPSMKLAYYKLTIKQNVMSVLFIIIIIFKLVLHTMWYLRRTFTKCTNDYYYLWFYCLANLKCNRRVSIKIALSVIVILQSNWKIIFLAFGVNFRVELHLLINTFYCFTYTFSFSPIVFLSNDVWARLATEETKFSEFILIKI